MVERDKVALEALEENRVALKASQVELVRADALEFVRADRAQYDVIFVDPPFSTSCGELLPKLLLPRLKPDGYVYYESASGLEWPPEWQVLRRSRAGKVVSQLVKRIGDEPHGGIPGDVRSDHAGA
jgi:16S rRNA G966 N2-methylase RsmD